MTKTGRIVSKHLTGLSAVPIPRDQFRKLPYAKQSRVHDGWPTNGMRATTRDSEAEVCSLTSIQRHDRRTAGRAQSPSTQRGTVSNEDMDMESATQ